MDSAVSREHWAKARQLPAWHPAQPLDPQIGHGALPCSCLVVLSQVALPYMQAKLESIYNRHRRQARMPLTLRITQRSSEVEPDINQVP